jgi:hypothetical protein
MKGISSQNQKGYDRGRFKIAYPGEKTNENQELSRETSMDREFG